MNRISRRRGTLAGLGMVAGAALASALIPMTATPAHADPGGASFGVGGGDGGGFSTPFGGANAQGGAGGNDQFGPGGASFGVGGGDRGGFSTPFGGANAQGGAGGNTQFRP